MLDHETSIRTIANLANEAIHTKAYLAALEKILNILDKTELKEKS